MTDQPRPTILNTNMSPWMRAGIAAFMIFGIALMVATNHFLTQRFSEDQRADAQLRAALYSANMVTLLRQQSLVPLLLARDPAFITALQSREYANTSQRLIEVAEDIRVASLSLVDIEGRVVAASDRRNLGALKADQTFVTQALREPRTIFTVTGSADDGGAHGFYYSRRVVSGNTTLGVIVVEVDMRQVETSWRNRNDMVAVTDSADTVILTSISSWRHNTLTNVLASEPPPSGLGLAFGPPRNRAEDNPYVYLDGVPLLRTEIRTGFRGWRLTYFSTLTDVRTQVNGILALELTGLALLLTLFLFLANKRLQRQSRLIAEESDQLRQLNARLSEEIEQRQKVERHLEVAEQSLEQASKLAAIGQMSAAVSHELNQPLAAMRTYLAGARLLLQRKRVDEALTSFHRIDDLIERMGAITRQMKSYARKGADSLTLVDLRDAVDGSLSMMAPQLGHTRVELRKTMPNVPVMVRADPVRLDQIIVNLLRNALDAVSEEPDPMIDILLVQGQQVSLSVRDNGHGIEDPEALFEPFYTTKKPGEGVGLGLAISAGIANELGGRLLARNARPKGAVFELQLPRAKEDAMKAAE
ncbi:sensor histidine kinase [Halovulum dunhuangense]|uniref:C4-dicarboxylate transport sensor protein DctB n=1 Tax=Halovulum dunhuangense TaxID=1505036 RepID=A0A849L306_9RHOB|nr:ATP-binding protein [Halovulum dunhuangense]NNU80614.1 sensor histidine kinase [Halovulum dunhuangense]